MPHAHALQSRVLEVAHDGVQLHHRIGDRRARGEHDASSSGQFIQIPALEEHIRAFLGVCLLDAGHIDHPKVGEQLFSDGTHRLLELFANVPNDEETFIARLAKLVTDD